ncbi:DsbA family protein [Rhizobium grahamii]|uniref:Thioredoxin-like fold protein n=1 Tax=Rhizobium grahamii CCGE 502 TaxID=990285 RepID=S3IE76_9HYPH|nr:DsbA family protein [Rhizobium grahamii]EPE97388.1 thioredoxin-like fold protein [Rhizobium grahamii CCGE 502]
MKLVLVADPMCSWCYGFGKEMTALQERHPEMSLEIVVGGLRAGATDVLDDAGKRFRLEHWARVEQASGLPFNRDGLMARQGFVYDTEPVCRAVVAARILKPEADLLTVFRAIQQAFYVDALDTTDGAVLAQVGAEALSAAGHPTTQDEFLAVWQAKSTIDAAASDFVRARSMGVSSFPTLFLSDQGKLRRVGNGYAHVETLEQEIGALLAA